MVLSPFQLCKRNISQNTPPTLCFKLIFLDRSSCQFSKKSPKTPTFSSCFLLRVFTKIQPRCPCFPMISVVELHDINPYFFPLWSRISLYKVPLGLKLLKIASFGVFLLFVPKKVNKAN